MRFTEDEKHAYVDEHRFCGLHPLGRKGFTMQAFGHLGQERYELGDESDVWAAGAPNKADLDSFELWQTTLGRAAENVPHEWIDPITLGLMRNPCRAADGFVYERAAIREWMQRQKRPTSPLTGVPLASRVLRPDTALQQRIRTELRIRGVIVPL